MSRGHVFTFHWYRNGKLLQRWEQHNGWTHGGVVELISGAIDRGGINAFNRVRLIDAPLDGGGKPNKDLFALDPFDTTGSVVSHAGWREIGGFTNNNGFVVRPTWQIFPPPTTNTSTVLHADPFNPTGSNNNGVFKFTKSVKAMGIAAGKSGFSGDPSIPPAQDSGELLATAPFDPSGRRISFRSGDILAVDYTLTVTGSQGTVFPIAFPP